MIITIKRDLFNYSASLLNKSCGSTERPETNQNLPFGLECRMTTVLFYQGLFVMSRSIRTELNINEAL